MRRKIDDVLDPAVRRLDDAGPVTRVSPRLACVCSFAALLAFAAPAGAQVTQPAGLRAKTPASRAGTDSTAPTRAALDSSLAERTLWKMPLPVKVPTRRTDTEGRSMQTQGQSMRDAVGIAKATKAAALQRAAALQKTAPPPRKPPAR
ncbi:MAG: hypothetical protein NTX19_09960 [Gemmatimonadetes bacterium]|nr:hypothetical protein [Gemmatimonadota bacterium]